MRQTLKEAVEDAQCANLLPPVFVCSVMAVIYSVFVSLHLLPMLQLGVPGHLQDTDAAHRGAVLCAASQLLVALFLTCYARAMLTNPGEVPDTLEWRYGAPNPSPTTREVKTSGEKRHCKWCLKYKPDRCHHCRVCQRCVLKMDHHCPWIMNCVGWGNHKYFFLLVFYAVLICWLVFITMLPTTIDSASRDMQHSSRFMLVMAQTWAFIMGSLMLVFFSFHVHLLLKGMTTIEYCEKRTRDPALHSPSYSQGSTFESICAVLGPKPMLWLLPCSVAAGNGIIHTSRAPGGLELCPDRRG